jgi:AbiV family abortive infection protein
MALALRNAKGLVTDAELLARARRYRRAFALSALALEEVGKVVWLTLLSHSSHLELSERQVRGLWRQFRAHEIKTALALHTAWRSVLYVRGLKRRRAIDVRRVQYGRRQYRRLWRARVAVENALEATGSKEIEDMKLRCLYVDYRGNRFVGPVAVTSTAARSITLIAEFAIRDAAKLRDSFRHSNTNDLPDAIYTVMFRSQIVRQMLSELQRADGQTHERGDAASEERRG